MKRTRDMVYLGIFFLGAGMIAANKDRESALFLIAFSIGYFHGKD